MENDIGESPRKRLKTDTEPTGDVVVGSETTKSDAQKELEVGITEYVSRDNEGFAGILKKRYLYRLQWCGYMLMDRYTDFLVNEILPNGQVLHLQTVATPEENGTSNEGAANEGTSNEGKTTEQTANAQGPKADGAKAESAPETPAEFELSEEDRATLDSFFGAETTKKIESLHKRSLLSNARPSEVGKLSTSVMTDRDQRVQVHQAIRRIFNSQLESTTDGDGMMWIQAAANRNKRDKGRGGGGRDGGRGQGRINWQELGGSYLHFTIYKENKDTMEVISYLARTLRTNPKSFQFAGTKDRRGVTVQRACAHRVLAEKMAKMNDSLRNARIGDFEYREHGLDLGDLSGNEFVVTLREAEVPGVDLNDPETTKTKVREYVGSALRNLRERGYFNYYGLQRFGTFSTRTDTIGVKMLQGDFRGACEAILHYPPQTLEAAQSGQENHHHHQQQQQANKPPISTDDKARAAAIHHFQTTGKGMEALEKLPRKFSAEMNLIRHLGRSRSDFLGALQMIPRNLRLMYVHAYQSRVWNFAVGERWRLYGDQVVEGDLVLVHEHRDKEQSSATDPTGDAAVDADGEVIIPAQASDAATTKDDVFTRARALTAAEASSGQYSIFDVVLPQPGFDILYPPNKMTDFYQAFMGSEQGGGLDPFDMRRKWKDISLSGSYRKILSRMMGDDYDVDVQLYVRDEEQFVRTDVDLAAPAAPAAPVAPATDTEQAQNEEKNKLAVVVKFQLGSSQYATMALRELMKGKVKAYTPEFGGR